MKKSLLSHLRILSRTLGFMLAGALLFAYYLRHTMETPPVEVLELIQFGFLPCWSLLIFGAEPAVRKPQKGPSPAVSGPAVLLISGIAGAGFLAQNYQVPSDLILPAVVASAGFIGAAMLRHFAVRHSGEIGEARLNSDGKPLGPWQPPKN